VRAVALSPTVSRPGYGLVAGLAFVWGSLLGRFHVSYQGGLLISAGMPRWAFGRGGTTVGPVYLTNHNINPGILEHEAVHREQWEKYGLTFIPLYIEEGQDATRNRFEVEAGLAKGGYGV